MIQPLSFSYNTQRDRRRDIGGFIIAKTRVGCADARIKTDKNSQAWVQDSMLQTQSQGFIWGWKMG